MASLFDSHCHLDIGALGRSGEAGMDVELALSAAEAVGVDEIVQVGVDVGSSRESVRQLERMSWR